MHPVEVEIGHPLQVLAIAVRVKRNSKLFLGGGSRCISANSQTTFPQGIRQTIAGIDHRAPVFPVLVGIVQHAGQAIRRKQGLEPGHHLIVVEAKTPAPQRPDNPLGHHHFQKDPQDPDNDQRCSTDQPFPRGMVQKTKNGRGCAGFHASILSEKLGHSHILALLGSQSPFLSLTFGNR